MVTQTLVPINVELDRLMDRLDIELDGLAALVEEWPSLPALERQSILIEFDDLLFTTLDQLRDPYLAPSQRARGVLTLRRVQASMPLLARIADYYPNALTSYFTAL